MGRITFISGTFIIYLCKPFQPFTPTFLSHKDMDEQYLIHFRLAAVVACDDGIQVSERMSVKNVFHTRHKIPEIRQATKRPEWVFSNLRSF